MVSDRVGDFIIRLKNAAAIGAHDVKAPYSMHLLSIAKKLKELGYLTDAKVEGKDGEKRTLISTLSYNERGEARLHGVKRVSKPGRRLYTKHTDAHRVKSGAGARILSTSAGIVSDGEARKTKVGGEELFEIW